MTRRFALYLTGFTIFAVLLLVAGLTVGLVFEAKNIYVEKPRFDLPNDVPWDRIPWKDMSEDFPWEDVPFDRLPADAPWEDIPWEDVPWQDIPDDLVGELPLDNIPWDSLPENMPWDELPRDLPWDAIPWQDVPWDDLPSDFPYKDIPWNDLPSDFNWQAVTCDHSFERSESYLAATCVVGGWDTYVCTQCGATELRQTEPTGIHVYNGEWQSRTAPTCVEEGLEFRVCEQCGVAEETQTVQPTGQHTYDEEWIEVQPATCVEQGLQHKLCNQCGGEEITQHTNPTGIHIYGATGKCDNCDMQQLTLRSGSDTKQYDGTPLAKHSYETVFGTLKQGHEIVASYKGSLSNVGVADNLFTVRITDEQGADVTDGYDITYEYGTLTLTRRQLTVKTDSAARLYDGTPLICHDYEQSGLADGDEIQITFTATLTERGTCANIATVRIVRGNADVTANYAIALVFGTLTVQ